MAERFPTGGERPEDDFSDVDALLERGMSASRARVDEHIDTEAFLADALARGEEQRREDALATDEEVAGVTERLDEYQDPEAQQ